MRKAKGDGTVKWEDMTEEQKRILIDGFNAAKKTPRADAEKPLGADGKYTAKELRFAIKREKF